MHIYFIGIGGAAIGPLARLTRDIGYNASGSDIERSRYTESIQSEGIPVTIGNGEENIASIHAQRPIDWVVYTSAVPADSPELQFARERRIRTSKRDVLINHILREKNLKMIAAAGTHGKTTTTGMLIWAFKQLGIPISYSIGSNISFGPNGKYENGSEYFIYEADEFDKNFLNFSPAYSLIASIDYDHPDTYPTLEDYKQAFRDFVDKSSHVTTWQYVLDYLNIPNSDKISVVDGNETNEIVLPGVHNRQNANLVYSLMQELTDKKPGKIAKILDSFPGTERRMELLVDNLYSDYAHHPVEIRATLQAAREVNSNVVAIYQPHQNKRQIEIKDQYLDSFADAKKVYWLPTYLSRESGENIISQDELIRSLDEPEKAEKADLDDDLYDTINRHRKAGDLVVMMSAGSLDEWAREHFIG